MPTGPSSDIPNRALTPRELKQFKKDQELKKLLDGVEQEFTKRGEVPAKWFGRLLAVLVVAVFLDLTGWISAFLDGGFYAALAFILQTVETVCIIGLAGLAVLGSVEAYRLQQARKKVTEEFEAADSE